MFNVPDHKILGRSRRARVVNARQACMFTLRYKLNLALTEVGSIMGRDHSTISYGIKATAALASSDEWHAQALRKLREDNDGG